MINWWNFRFSEIEVTLLWICEMRFKLSGKGDNNKWHTCFTFSCMCFSIFTVMPMSFPSLISDERWLKGREIAEKWKFHFIIVFLALLHTDRATRLTDWYGVCQPLLHIQQWHDGLVLLHLLFALISRYWCWHFPLNSIGKWCERYSIFHYNCTKRISWYVSMMYRKQFHLFLFHSSFSFPFQRRKEQKPN